MEIIIMPYFDRMTKHDQDIISIIIMTIKDIIIMPYIDRMTKHGRPGNFFQIIMTIMDRIIMPYID